MPTTITLTPTLTLSVANRSMPQSSVESVWSSINQHIRATGRTSTISVMDGSEQLRLWQLTPEGERTELPVPELPTGEQADFSLSLSPWLMSVPRPEGSEVHQVSTLAVARAQAVDAATAGQVELILLTAGTDEDKAETVSPLSPQVIEATEELDDDDLWAELEDEDDPQQDKTTRRRRWLLVAGACTLGAVVLTGAGLGTWAHLTTPSSEQAPSAAPAPVTASPTPSSAPSSAAPVTSTAQAPLGFSGTASWEAVGATDQSAGLSWSGRHSAAVSGRTLNIVSTESGDLLDSLALPQTTSGAPMPLAGPGSEGGVIIEADDAVMTWGPDDDVIETEIPDDRRLVMRGSTAFTVPQNQDTRPESIELITPSGTTEVTSPGESSSPIGLSDDGFLWAAATDGGTLIRADFNGEETESTRLIGPSSGTTIAQWLGASDDYAVAIWANDGSGSILAIHDAETGEVVDTEDLGTSPAGLRIAPSHDGQYLLAGSTLLDLGTGSIGEPVEDMSTTSRDVTAVPGGWTATDTEGGSMFISTAGDTVQAPTETETLLGLAETDDIVVNNRGALAAYPPAPETTSAQ